jgi:hypothetical protein
VKTEPAKGEAAKIQTWLYHKEKGGKIHALVPGAALPKGWRDTPWPAPPEEKGEKEKGADAPQMR